MSLTPEQIENWREYIILLVGNTAPQKAVDRAQVNEIFDLALSAARKDKALRDEVIEECAKVCAAQADLFSKNLGTYEHPLDNDAARIRAHQSALLESLIRARAAVEEAGQTEPDPG